MIEAKRKHTVRLNVGS